MFSLLDFGESNIVGFRIDGDFTEKELDHALNALKEKAQQHERINFYYEIENLDLSKVSLKMIKNEFRFLFNHPDVITKIQNVALLTDTEWIRKAFAVEAKLIPTITGKNFDLRHKDEAILWLITDHREGQRLDVVLPELIQYGAIKGLGGFGIGLILANFLSKRERKNLGALAIGSSILLALPLGARFLNNNRKFLER